VGNQQILLIILGVIVVGIAVTIALFVFGTNSDQASKDALTHGCLNIVSSAQAYFRKPRMLGGGGNAFDGIEIVDCGMTDTGDGTGSDLNGTYRIITAAGNDLVVEGISATNSSQMVTVAVDMNAISSTQPYMITYSGW